MPGMKTYGQFCSIAKALEIVGERWTPLIMRELICGSSRFNEIHRGVPRISPSLLSKRLNVLEQAGIVRRAEETGGYQLTPAGWELKPVIEMLGVWGQRWVRGQLSDDDFDPDLLMWDIRRRINLEHFPQHRTCICFEFSDMPREKALYWLVGSADGVELCITEPGYDVDLFVTTDVRTMTRVWNGDLTLTSKIEDGSIDLHGQSKLREEFHSWLRLSLFANVERAAKGD
ncbi:MAG: winged helix-turn-helix transcriptional regulator [Roseiarcus sp.]